VVAILEEGAVMGLDMYLSVRKYVSGVARWQNYEPVRNEKFDELVKLAEAEDLLCDDSVVGGHVEIPVYYWRKANSIHQFFIDNYADGVDNCKPVYLPRAALEDLVDRCNKIIEDPDRASEHLPTVSGFFFGSTDYDDWYMDSIKQTRDDMQELLDKLEAKADIDFDLVYEASW
jgi:hypothetical protein